MSFCLFVVFKEAVAVEDGVLRQISGMQKTHIYTPDSARDPFLDDGPPPPLALQLYFRSLAALEAADFSGLGARGEASCQAMEVRRFVDAPVQSPFCTYLVAYEGPAQDPAAWHAFYLEHHPPLMAKLPGLRQLEIYLPVESAVQAPWPRENCLQRNKVAFDTSAALGASLESPERKAMRADFGRFPAYGGGVSHYPMATRVIEVASRGSGVHVPHRT